MLGPGGCRKPTSLSLMKSSRRKTKTRFMAEYYVLQAWSTVRIYGKNAGLSCLGYPRRSYPAIYPTPGRCCSSVWLGVPAQKAMNYCPRKWEMHFMRFSTRIADRTTDTVPRPKSGRHLRKYRIQKQVLESLLPELIVRTISHRPRSYRFAAGGAQRWRTLCFAPAGP